MPAADSSSNGGSPREAARAGERDGSVEGLTVTVGRLRRGGREVGQGGFGLDLVDRLAARWGAMRNRDTKVWFGMGRARPMSFTARLERRFG